MYWYIILIVAVVLLFIIFMNRSTGIAIAVEEKKPVEKKIEEPKSGLDDYYQPAKEKVDLDYPPKNIGCCPFSKPMSKDLPIANVPMCYAANNKSYLENKAI